MHIQLSLLLLLTFGLSQTSFAQVEYLRLSPAQSITQRVGATDVTLKFSRPQMKGRKIFGTLVPYDKMWRTGANENTTISFDHRVRIGETEVVAGKYALFTKVMKDKWEAYLYTDTDNLDVPNPIDSTKLIYLTSVATKALDYTQEILVINFYNITENSAALGISWENTEVMIPIHFYTREAMEAQIAKEFKQNIFDYSITSEYYSQRGIELEKAKKLRELAMELKEEPNEWDYHSYSKILYQLGDKKEAIANIQRSLELAKKAGNAYIVGESEGLLELWDSK